MSSMEIFSDGFHKVSEQALYKIYYDLHGQKNVTGNSLK